MANGKLDTGSYEKRWSHLKDRIKLLIITTDRYIVFIDIDDDLDWETTQEYDQSAPNEQNYNVSSHNKVLNEAAILETTPCDGIDKKIQVNFKRLIGEALGCSLDHDYVTADRMLEKAQAFIFSRGEEISRVWYLEASFKVAIIPIAIGALAIIFRNSLTGILSENGLWLVIAGCAGSLGSLLSIIGRTGKLKFDHSGGKRLHNFEGASRITTGVISGILAGLAVRSNLLFGTIIYENKQHLVMVAVALVAGTSERLVNSIINKISPEKDKSPSSST